jgi:hypothetical protein
MQKVQTCSTSSMTGAFISSNMFSILIDGNVQSVEGL